MSSFMEILSDQFALRGVTLFGTFFVALAFSVFYGKNTQYMRFHLISNGFWILAASTFILILIPCLSLLNPALQPSETALNGFMSMLYACAAGYFLASLFTSFPRKTLMFFIPFFFACLWIGLGYGLMLLNLRNLPLQNIPLLFIGFSLVISALGFHTIAAISQKAIFTVPRASLFSLGIYFILYAFQLISKTQIIPFFLYAFAAIVVLIAQLRFMESTAVGYAHALEEEKKRKTFFWDVAPFPILLTKLIDDSVVYMNSACQKILGLDDSQKQNLHFSAFFADKNKRIQLIDLTKQCEVVDNFEVELNVQNSEKTVWITLSSRVFEVDGELVLYINFTNITEQKETEQELFIQASTDTLTGLYNRRQFFALTEQAFALASREQTPYCVIMLDIDHFKNINDTYGHDAGDVVLKNLAQIMKQTLRKSDIIARWGGEEFIVFLQSTTPQQAVAPANKLRQAVENSPIVVGNQTIHFTISLGISLNQTPDITALQKEADLALYTSKESGRNQATLYAQEAAPSPATPKAEA